MPDYKLVGSTSPREFQNLVNNYLSQGYTILGPHTHVKANHSDIPEQSTWSNYFTISMYKP